MKKPFRVPLKSLGHRTLRLAKPISVSIDPDDGGFVVARWEEALLEGEAFTRREAMYDLKVAIIDAYEDLRGAQNRGLVLAGHPAELWKLLKDLVIEPSRKGQS